MQGKRLHDDLKARGLLLSDDEPCMNCGGVLSDHEGGRCLFNALRYHHGEWSGRLAPREAADLTWTGRRVFNRIASWEEDPKRVHPTVEAVFGVVLGLPDHERVFVHSDPCIVVESIRTGRTEHLAGEVPLCFFAPSEAVPTSNYHMGEGEVLSVRIKNGGPEPRSFRVGVR